MLCTVVTMALYSLKGRIYIDENDEIYIRQRPLQEDVETLGRRMQEKITTSQAAKLYPRQDPNSPRRQAVIISHTAPFIPTSKKKIDEITARLSASRTFATKMRASDAPPEPPSKTCPKRTNSDITKETPPSPRPAKSLLKKPLRTKPLQNQNIPQNNNTRNSANNKTANRTSQDNTKKNVRFNSPKSNENSRGSSPKTGSNSHAKQRGDFLRLLLEES